MMIWDLVERTQKMKGKRHTIAERIRIPVEGKRRRDHP